VDREGEPCLWVLKLFVEIRHVLESLQAVVAAGCVCWQLDVCLSRSEWSDVHALQRKPGSVLCLLLWRWVCAFWLLGLCAFGLLGFCSGLVVL
jgi:hypothetical protein